MRPHWGRLFVAIALALALAGPAAAQDRRGRRPGGEWGGERGGGWSRRGEPPAGDVDSRIRARTERAERMVVIFDANQDGVIEPNEIRGQSRFIFERMAKEAGLNPSHSIAVTELRTAVVRQIEKEERERGQPAAQAPGQPPPGGPAPPGTAPGSAPPPQGGFGRPAAETPKPGGFGPPAGPAPAGPGAASPSRSFGQGPAGGAPAANPTEKRELDERIRNYAKSLLERYDTNKNGVLEKDEWQHMRGSPERSDRNNDGVITLDELTARLAEFSDRGSSDSGRSGGGPPPASSSTTSTSPAGGSSSGSSGTYVSRTSSSPSGAGQRGTYRFLSPLERLPKGLPEWFARKDADGDGQVSMAEFSAEWDDAKAGEFAKYDLNGDGIITPQECLQAEKAK